MQQFSFLPLILTTSVLLLSTQPASAWTPSTEPAVGEGESMPSMPVMPGYPLPDYQGYPRRPPMGYGPPAYPRPPMPYAAPAGIESGGGSVALEFAGMRLTQDRNDDAYTLDIELGDVEPSQVRIEPMGSALVIISEQSAQSRREERFADGRGFSRSFSYSSGRMTKRLPVPPDGDLSAMQREDSEGRVRILIPRVAMPSPAPQGPSSTPVQPRKEQQ